MTKTKPACSVDGCRKPAYCRGLCRPHYGLGYRNGTLPPRQMTLDANVPHRLSNKDPEAMTADCSECGPGAPMRIRVRRGKNGGQRLEFGCKVVQRRQAKERLERGSQRVYDFRIRYGITVDEYDQMLAAQDGKCAICLNGEAKLFVDHDHETGDVRGLLCHYCNVALAWLRDDATRALRAYEYLSAAVLKLALLEDL